MRITKSILMLSMLALSFVIVSCDKDDDEEKKNQFTYDGKDYPLAKGIVENYGMYNESPASYNFDLTLLSSGITVDSEADFSGEGDALYFEMFSSSETELIAGTYTYDQDESYNANTFDFGIMAINYNTDSETYEVQKFITSGTVKVEKDGATFMITVDCIADGGKTIKGYYKGTLSSYDWSGWSQKSATLNMSNFKTVK